MLRIVAIPLLVSMCHADVAGSLTGRGFATRLGSMRDTVRTVRGERGLRVPKHAGGGAPLMRLVGGADVAKRKVLDEYTHEIKSRHEGQSGAIKVEMWLHWGFATRGSGWIAPADEFLPEGTKKVDARAVQSPFKNGNIVLRIPESQAPEALAFVLKRDTPEEWFNGPGGDFWVDFKPMDPAAVGTLIIEREARASHWSILDRMRLVNENIKAVAESPEGLAWIYTLLRFNVLKLVPLTRNSNYQSKDLAHTQDGVSRSLAALYGRYQNNLWTRTYSRLCIGSVPRGGGNGDAIRLEILDIMRRHGIKEGHRPGIEDKFLEDWHQKLHTNCAPDDIIIAEAYIKFLESNNPDAYWGHLKANGLSWEYMCSIGGGKGSANSGLCGMKATPLFLPQLIGDIKHLRWTLMQVHGGADLDFLITKASGGLDGELKGILNEIQCNRHEWWIPGKVTEARRKLAGYLENPQGHRDALMLDVTLDNWFKLGIEKADFSKLSGDDLMETISLTLENVALSYGGEYWSCLQQFNAVKGRSDKWSEHGARLLKATVERVALALQSHMDTLYQHIQPKAVQLGAEMKADQAYITNFGEEVVRGLPSFVLSQLLSTLDPMARAAGKMGAWEVGSAVKSVAGTVAVMDDMVAIQGKSFDKPQVLVVGKVGGIEDIPPGVVAILTRSATDVLSHVAIRARNQGVLLATCHDDKLFAGLKAVTGYVKAAVNAAGEVTLESAPEPASAAESTKKAAPAKPLVLKAAVKSKAFVVPDSQFSSEILGGKSNNLQALRARLAALPDFVRLPASVALPFGACERVMAEESNAAVRTQIEALEASLTSDPAKDGPILAQIRDSFDGLQAPKELEKELAACCKEAGVDAALTADFEACFGAVKRVWASKWSDRATYSRRACGVPHKALQMGVLVQQVVDAEYAFVLHTRNPVTGADDEIMGEVVVGLGESLVGNYPGRALSFVANKKTGAAAVAHHASKRLGVFLKGDTLIFRSDSNGEDLEGFAGAGLYDSVMATRAEERPVDYAGEKLLFDDAFRAGVLAKLVEAGKAVEKAMGAPQDVEGVVRQGLVHIVQTRPQV